MDLFKIMGKVVVDTQGAVNSLNSVTKQAQNTATTLSGKVGQALQNVGGKISQFGKALAPVSAAAAALVTGAGAAWKELDKAFDTIAAGTGATGEKMEAFKENFKNVYGSFPADSAEVAQAIADINTRLGLEGDELEEATTKFLQYSRVNGVDVAASIETVSHAMMDAGIPTSELGETLDILTASSQASGMSVDEMAGLLQTNGASMRAFGFDTKESIAMLATFEKNGMNTSVMMTGFKMAMNQCAKEGKDAKAEMEKFFKKCQDGSVTSADAVELFGTRAGATIYQYAKEGKLNFEDMMAVVEGSNGQLAASYEEMADPMERMGLIMNNLKIAGTELFATLIDMAAPVIDVIIDKVKAFSDWLRNLGDKTKKGIAIAGVVVSALSPVLMIVGNIISFVGGLITKLSGVGKVIGMLTTPVGLVVGAIAGLIAIFVTMYKTNDEFKEKVNRAWETIQNKIGKIVSSLKATIQAALDAIKAFWDAHGEEIMAVASAAWEAIQNIITVAFDTIMAIVGPAMDAIAAIIDLAMAVIQGDWSKAWDSIKALTSAVWEMIKAAIQGVLNIIKALIQAAWNVIKTVTATVWNSIKAVLVSVWEGIKSAVSNAINAVQTTVTNVFTAISSMASSIWNGIKSTISSVVNGISSTVSSVFNGVSSTVSSIWNGIKTTITNAINGAKDAVSGAISKIKSLFNFSWKLPSLKLPHIKYDIIKVPVLGNIPDPRTLKVEWYRKGMLNAQLLRNPAIFGLDPTSGNFLGGGEAGEEVVAGASTLMGMIGRTVAAHTAKPNADPAAQAVLQYLSSGNFANDLADALAGKLGIELDGRQLGRVVKKYA